MHLHRLWIAGLALAMISASPALARRGNVPAGQNGSPASGGNSCMTCHSGSGSGSISIFGFPAEYVPNSNYDLTVRIADPVQAGAGFQVSVEDAGGTHVGTLSLLDLINTRLNPADNNFVDHTSTGVDNSVTNWAGLGNAAEFQVRWTAPPSDIGAITLWAAGNAINNNFANSGDITYLTSQTISAAPPTCDGVSNCSGNGTCVGQDICACNSGFVGPDCSAAIPTVSQWGLIAMSLLMLTAGTIVMGRTAFVA